MGPRQYELQIVIIQKESMLEESEHARKMLILISQCTTGKVTGGSPYGTILTRSANRSARMSGASSNRCTP